jgi:hypothetical protein
VFWSKYFCFPQSATGLLSLAQYQPVGHRVLLKQHSLLKNAIILAATPCNLAAPILNMAAVHASETSISFY